MRRLVLCSSAVGSLAAGLLTPAAASAYQHYSLFLTAGRPGVPTLSVAIPPRGNWLRRSELGAPAILAQPLAGLPNQRQPYQDDWLQQWLVVCGRSAYAGGPWPTACRFVNRDSAKCLDVKGPSSANGTVVHQWNCHAGDSQKWTFTGSRLINVYATSAARLPKCLDVTAFNARVGTRLQIWACSSGWNQSFRLQKADPPEPTGRSTIP